MKTRFLHLSLSLVLLSASRLAAVDPCCSASQPPTVATTTVTASLPGDSLYHLTAAWRDQSGRPVTLADFAGKPVVITMVFTHCAYACPRIVVDLKAIRDALPANVRGQVRFILASFDTARDTPERLQVWAAEQDLGVNWTLLHGEADAVRELSVALEIPYLPQADGGFAHGNRVVLLDAHGVMIAAHEGLGAAPGPIAEAAINLITLP